MLLIVKAGSREVRAGKEMTEKEAGMHGVYEMHAGVEEEASVTGHAGLELKEKAQERKYSYKSSGAC